ncbi:MAG: hypothetical protein F6J93_17175 [Oscillatoria sp. SIO1A7]|nr:hypothetical protein [Oscillatoria sp. SIO1A7]
MPDFDWDIDGQPIFYHILMGLFMADLMGDRFPHPKEIRIYSTMDPGNGQLRGKEEGEYRLEIFI